MKKIIMTLVFSFISLVYVPETSAAPWQQMSILTQEGDTLTVEKKGRGRYRINISSYLKSESIKCSSIYQPIRSSAHISGNSVSFIRRNVLGHLIKNAGLKSGSNSFEEVVSYQETLNAISTIPYTSMLSRGCALGLVSQNDDISFTLGGIFKMNGRVATVSSEEAIRIGEFLIGK